MSDGKNIGLSFEQLRLSERETVVGALRRGATRREVMGWLMAAGATIASASSIVAGASEAFAQTPKKGGRVRYAHDAHGPADTLDPALSTAQIDHLRGRAYFNSLIRLDEKIQPQPELAESFEPNTDAREWTLTIRKGVTFHDGKPMTADDVIYSMNRHSARSPSPRPRPSSTR